MCEVCTYFVAWIQVLGFPYYSKMTKDLACHRGRLISAPWWAIKRRRIQCDTEKRRKVDGVLVAVDVCKAVCAIKRVWKWQRCKKCQSRCKPRSQNVSDKNRAVWPWISL